MPNPDGIMICMDCGAECHDVEACPECQSTDLMGLEQHQHDRAINDRYEYYEDMKMFKELKNENKST
jgi:hypothetical protein